MNGINRSVPYRRRRGKEKNKNFRSAIIKISKRIKDIKGGIGPGIYQTDLQELFRHNGLQYRIDVEIQRGVNFKK